MKKIIYPFLLLIFPVACTTNRNLHKPALVWEENFDQTETFDATRWSKIPRGKSDWNRHMSNFDSLYAWRDGKLILRGIVNTTQKDDTSTYLTGGVYTKDKVGFGLGRIEIRAKLGNATGAWPAFWLLGQGMKYPGGGEIDILEHLNHDDFIYQTVHSYYTITLNEKNNPKHGGTGRIRPEEFNTYAVEIHKNKVVFYVNGIKTFTYPKIKTDKPGQFPFADAEHYLLLDMQLGGNWVGKINPEELPVEMEIDWVRYYKFKE